MVLTTKTKNVLTVAMADQTAANELSASVDAAAAASVLAAARTMPSNYYMVGAGSIQAAINQAVSDGHNDNNKAFVVVSQDKTENITLAPGVFLIGLNSSGTHSPWVITGQVTVNSVSGTIDSNHYAISGLAIVGPSTLPAMTCTGTAPQRVFLKDVWITANGVGGHCFEMSNSGAGSIAELDEFKASHNGTGYAMHIVLGVCVVEDVETSGSIAIARVEAGATLSILSGECDANAATAFDVAAGGTLTLTRCTLSNIAANGIGINLLAAGAVAVVGEVLFSTPLAGTGRVINGVAGSILYYQFIAFAPGSSTKINPAITAAVLSVTPSFT